MTAICSPGVSGLTFTHRDADEKKFPALCRRTAATSNPSTDAIALTGLGESGAVNFFAQPKSRPLLHQPQHWLQGREFGFAFGP